MNAQEINELIDMEIAAIALLEHGLRKDTALNLLKAVVARLDRAKEKAEDK